jgi:hypothetical protein
VPPIRDPFRYYKIIMHKTCYLLILAAVIILPGCGSAPKEKPSQSASAGGITYKRTDSIDKVWIAEGFDFGGYDTLVVEPVAAGAVKPKDDKEKERLEMARQSLQRDLKGGIEFAAIVPKVADAASGGVTNKVLRLESEILEFSRGSTAVRIGIGFGAGAPYLKLRGTVKDGASGNSLVIYELDETGDWFDGISSSQTLQRSAGTEMVDDIMKLLTQVARRQPIKYK